MTEIKSRTNVSESGKDTLLKRWQKEKCDGGIRGQGDSLSLPRPFPGTALKQPAPSQRFPQLERRRSRCGEREVLRAGDSTDLSRPGKPEAQVST